MTVRRTVVLTALTLVAFASNSIFCRLALAKGEIDAASFTSIRIISGAIVLGMLAIRGRWVVNPISAAALFVYAAPFSFAYLKLGAGVGALVLFTSVQATMIGWGVARGERPRALVWVGLAIALAGLAFLAAPGATAPDLAGVALMIVAGIAWGAYSLRGKGSAARAIDATAMNFIACVPLALLLPIPWHASMHVSTRGAALAIASGAVSSGVGYSLWYAALEGLTATRAALVQLSVPILAAIGGILFLGEHLTLRLVCAAIAILGGVAIAITRRA